MILNEVGRGAGSFCAALTLPFLSLSSLRDAEITSALVADGVTAGLGADLGASLGADFGTGFAWEVDGFLEELLRDGISLGSSASFCFLETLCLSFTLERGPDIWEANAEKGAVAQAPSAWPGPKL